MRALVSTICVVAAALAASGAGARQPTDIRQWVAAHQQPLVRELVDLLSLPNVAADRVNIRRNADHLRLMLERRGLAAHIIETAGNPRGYGERRVPDARRTLLL